MSSSQMLPFVWACFVSLAFTDDFFEQCNSENSTDADFIDNYFDLQNKLSEKLLNGYNPILAPIYLSDRYGKPQKQMYVNLTLTAFRLLKTDESRQSANVVVDIRYDWIDPRLTWNTSDYCGMEQFAVTNKGEDQIVWVPDITSRLSSSYTDTLPFVQQTVNIYYNGSMTIYKTLVIDFICRMDLRNYPFDEQACALALGSMNYPQAEMHVEGIYVPGYIDLANAGNGEWIVFSILAEDGEMIYNEKGGVYSNPTFWFYFKRSTNYYVLLLIIPSFIVTVLCIIGLFWTSIKDVLYMDSLNLGFAAILAMMFNMQIGTQDMPKINETDKLSIYLLINLCLITLAICVALALGKVASYYLKKGRQETKTYQFLFVKNRIYKHLHLILMLTFTIMAIINLVVLICRKTTDSMIRTPKHGVFQ